MARCLVVFDVCLKAESPSDEIEQRLKMVPGVKDLEQIEGEYFQYRLEFYTVANPFKDEEIVEPVKNHIREFFNNYIPGVSIHRVSFSQWLS